MNWIAPLLTPNRASVEPRHSPIAPSVRIIDESPSTLLSHKPSKQGEMCSYYPINFDMQLVNRLVW